MIGADIETDAWAVIVKLAEAAKTEKEGALVLTAGTNTLRFLPPYTISKKEIDRGLALLEKVITCH
jgi:acetylornithine/succinyldiaminopimelate/putrescine aminotransferase